MVDSKDPEHKLKHNKPRYLIYAHFQDLATETANPVYLLQELEARVRKLAPKGRKKPQNKTRSILLLQLHFLILHGLVFNRCLPHGNQWRVKPLSIKLLIFHSK